MVRERLLGEEKSARRRSSPGRIERGDQTQARSCPLQRKLRNLPRRCRYQHAELTVRRATSDVYPEKLRVHGLDLMRPNDQEREKINRIIMDGLTYGVFKPEAILAFQQIIGRMQSEGCDAVVLGCTEMIMNDQNSLQPVLDSTRLLARAALRRATRGKIAPVKTS